MYELDICILYSEYLNLYSDLVNAQILQKRMEWRGHKMNLHYLGEGQCLSTEKYDMFLIGGGTDIAQKRLLADFKKKAEALKECMEQGKVILAVSEGFQLFGKYYVSLAYGKIEMSGLLPFYTEEDSPRLKGNLLVRREDGSFVTGFENHWGRTFLTEGLQPLGTVEAGSGNNGTDLTEGVHYKNLFGTYCHGPVLSTAPEFADELLTLALLNKYKEAELPPLDDRLEKEAAKQR